MPVAGRQRLDLDLAIGDSAKEARLELRPQLTTDQIRGLRDDERRSAEPITIMADEVGAGLMVWICRVGSRQEDAGIDDQCKRSSPKPSASMLSASAARRPELEVPMATKLGCRCLAGRSSVGSDAAHSSMTASTLIWRRSASARNRAMPSSERSSVTTTSTRLCRRVRGFHRFWRKVPDGSVLAE